MRINLLDGSLKSFSGHPHDIDMTLLKAMVKAGHDVHVYSHVDMDSVLAEQYRSIAPLTQLFKIDPYTRPEKFDTLAGDICKNLDGAKMTVQELAQVREADVWLWPSLYPHQLLACAMAKPVSRVAGCIHHPPQFLSPEDAQWWRYAYLQCHYAGVRARTGTLDRELCYAYLPYTVYGQMPLLPYPSDGIDEVKQHASLKIIGIFGSQRDEKGLVFLEALVRQLLAKGYQVVLHDSAQQSVSLFESMPGVKALSYIENLLEEIAACDLVITPYHVESYRQRASAITMNALSCGVPVVAPLGSAPGRVIEASGAGTLFTHFSLPSILAAVDQAARAYPAIAEAAFRSGKGWKQRHGVMKFVDALIQ